MASPNNIASYITSLDKLPKQKIAQAISVILLVYIAYIAAKITWLIFPQTSIMADVSPKNTVADQYKKNQSFSMSGVQALNLFGQYNAQKNDPVVAQITDAPKTRLQLTLSGLVASDNVENAAAIIENKGKQATYGIGDIIKGTRASLEQVLIDRVIIKQSGRLETLMLDGADFNQAAQSVSNKNASNKKIAQQKIINNRPQRSPLKASSSVMDQRSNDELSQAAQALRNDLTNDPGKITDYLRISPARKGSDIVGYRLSPGSNADFFKLSGLKSGDIAVQMNGHDLLAPLEAAQAMSALKTERNISLLVKRQNDLIEILFSID
jgi:general secretion pathway protein C